MRNKFDYSRRVAKHLNSIKSSINIELSRRNYILLFSSLLSGFYFIFGYFLTKEFPPNPTEIFYETTARFKNCGAEEDVVVAVSSFRRDKDNILQEAIVNTINNRIFKSIEDMHINDSNFRVCLYNERLPKFSFRVDKKLPRRERYLRYKRKTMKIAKKINADILITADVSIPEPTTNGERRSVIIYLTPADIQLSDLVTSKQFIISGETADDWKQKLATELPIKLREKITTMILTQSNDPSNNYFEYVRLRANEIATYIEQLGIGIQSKENYSLIDAGVIANIRLAKLSQNKNSLKEALSLLKLLDAKNDTTERRARSSRLHCLLYGLKIEINNDLKDLKTTNLKCEEAVKIAYESKDKKLIAQSLIAKGYTLQVIGRKKRDIDILKNAITIFKLAYETSKSRDNLLEEMVIALYNQTTLDTGFAVQFKNREDLNRAIDQFTFLEKISESLYSDSITTHILTDKGIALLELAYEFKDKEALNLARSTYQKALTYVSKKDDPSLYRRVRMGALDAEGYFLQLSNNRLIHRWQLFFLRKSYESLIREFESNNSASIELINNYALILLESCKTIRVNTLCRDSASLFNKSKALAINAFSKSITGLNQAEALITAIEVNRSNACRINLQNYTLKINEIIEFSLENVADEDTVIMEWGKDLGLRNKNIAEISCTN